MRPLEFLQRLLHAKARNDYAVLGWKPGTPTRLSAGMVNEEMRAHLRETSPEAEIEDVDSRIDFDSGRLEG